MSILFCPYLNAAGISCTQAVDAGRDICLQCPAPDCVIAERQFTDEEKRLANIQLINGKHHNERVERQKQALVLQAQGLHYTEIAQQMRVALSTVWDYCNSRSEWNMKSKKWKANQHEQMAT